MHIICLHISCLPYTYIYLLQSIAILWYTEVYKECLDLFLEGVVDNGGALKRKLLECEYRKDQINWENTLSTVDRKSIGRILSLQPEFRLAVHEISQLFQEMQVVKFVGQNPASSKRRRRMEQQAAREENLVSKVYTILITLMFLILLIHQLISSCVFIVLSNIEKCS